MSLLQQLLNPNTPSALIQAAFADIDSMLGHSRRMLEIALATLLDNHPLEEDLDRLDDAVDLGERMVRRAVLQHLSVQPEEDLVQSLILTSIAQDCERLGDSARGLGDVALLARSPRQGQYRDRLDSLRSSLLPLFDLASRSFQDGDADGARTVVDRAGDVKSQVSQLVTDLTEEDLSPDMVVVYAVSARIFGRIASHLSNIASAVVQPFDNLRHDDEEA